MRTLLLLLALPLATATAQVSPISDMDRIRRAVLSLPTRTDELRRAGVADQVIAATIDAMRADRMSTVDIVDILTVERDDVWRTRQPENFGMTVQRLKARGLRGKALADAIHAEKARNGGNNGIGRGNDKGRSGYDDKDKDKGKKRDDDDRNGNGNGRGRGNGRGGR